MERVIRVGGSFAPPITPEKVAEYRKLAEEADSPAVQEAIMSLCDMMDEYLGTELATGTSEPHSIGAIRKRDGRSVVPTITTLAPEDVERLDPHVPWPHECDMYATLFAPLQAAEASKNARLLQEWRGSVERSVFREMLPDEDYGVLGREATHRAAVAAFAKMGENGRTALQAVTAALFPSGTDRKALQAKIGAFRTTVQDVLAAPETSPVPRPALADTKLRDAAHHLLWFAVELSKDRVPLTSDKL